MIGGRVVTELLPVACWPDSDLLAFRHSIARALARERVSGHELVTALSWADMIDDELEARGLLGSAVYNRCGVRPPPPRR